MRSASLVLEPSFLIFQKIESSRSEQVNNKSLSKICIIIILETQVSLEWNLLNQSNHYADIQ